MTKQDIVDFISQITGDDERVAIVYVDPNGEGDAEEGDVLEIINTGYEPRLGHVVRVGKS